MKEITCAATIYLMAMSSSAAPDIVMRPGQLWKKVIASRHWLVWTSHSMGTGISNSNLGRTCRKQFTESFCLLHVHELSMHRSPCSQLDSLFKTLCLFWQVTHFHSLFPNYYSFIFARDLSHVRGLISRTLNHSKARCIEHGVIILLSIHICPQRVFLIVIHHISRTDHKGM